MKRFAFLLIAVLLAGCTLLPLTKPVITGVPLTPEQVGLTTSDSIALSATLYPADSSLAVVLAHMGISDQTAWSAFAGEVALQGVTALTFDFRCFGESECSTGDDDRLHLLDVQAAIAFLRGRGYERIACVGASLGAAACLNATMIENLSGLGFIAGGLASPIDARLYPLDMINPGMPKLFLVADQDPSTIAIQATQSFYDRSPEPKQLLIYQDNVHGTELFGTASRDRFINDLMDFILGIN